MNPAVAGYKITTYKSVDLQYSSNEQSENENFKICNSFKKIKILKNKFNQSSARLVYWKLQNINERN